MSAGAAAVGAADAGAPCRGCARVEDHAAAGKWHHGRPHLGRHAAPAQHHRCPLSNPHAQIMLATLKATGECSNAGHVVSAGSLKRLYHIKTGTDRSVVGLLFTTCLMTNSIPGMNLQALSHEHGKVIRTEPLCTGVERCRVLGGLQGSCTTTCA